MQGNTSWIIIINWCCITITRHLTTTCCRNLSTSCWKLKSNIIISQTIVLIESSSCYGHASTIVTISLIDQSSPLWISFLKSRNVFITHFKWRITTITTTRFYCPNLIRVCWCRNCIIRLYLDHGNGIFKIRCFRRIFGMW